MTKPREFNITENIDKYIGARIECDCGETHYAPLTVAIVENSSLEKIPSALNSLNCVKPLIVSDVNTEIAAGKKVKEILNRHNLRFNNFIYPDNHLTADPCAIGRLLIAADSDCDIIIAVGSGTINDICKFIAFKTGKKLMVVPTAASMDGFLTNVSILTINGLKCTTASMMPDAIITDVDVIANSPMDMLAAGVGDMLGKPVSLLDWKIANTIVAEKYCEFTDNLVDFSYNMVLKETHKLSGRDKGAVANVFNGLILLGFGMAYNGTSRPGSGAEHQLSHFWEMAFAKKGMPPVYHGTKVGIGTCICLEIWKIIKETKIDFSAAIEKARNFSYDKWRYEIERVYGSSCEDVFLLEEKSHKNEPEKVIKNIGLLETNFNKILDWTQNLPESKDVEQILNSMGAPSSPKRIGVDKQLFIDTIYYAKDMRNRYSLLQILFDLNLQDAVTEKLVLKYYG